MAEDQVQQLAAQLEAAKQETEAVRQKLHNAVRKGKAIDAEKKKKEEELQELAARLKGLEERYGSPCPSFFWGTGRLQLSAEMKTQINTQ